jgi:hypothetical protein
MRTHAARGPESVAPRLLFPALLILALAPIGPLLRVPAARADAGAAGASPPACAQDYGSLFEPLTNLKPDPDRVAPVKGLRLARDAGVFDLEDGSLVLCRPVGGRVCAAVFVGRGSFSLRPPSDTEREELRRFSGLEELREPLGSLVLLFADSTAAELQRRLAFGPGSVPGGTGGLLKEFAGYVSLRSAEYLEEDLAATFLNGQSNGLFLAQLGEIRNGPLFFEIDPLATESVSLMRRGLNGGSGGALGRDVICQFPPAGADPRGLDSDWKPAVNVSQHRLECAIDADLGFAASDRLEFQLLQDGQPWVRFSLFPELMVDSVLDEAGSPVPFHRGEKDPMLWVRLAGEPRAGQVRALRVVYHGPLLERLETQGDWIVLKSFGGWYPSHDPMGYSAFDLTFRCPAEFSVISVGKRVLSEARGDTVVSRWATERPVRLASFNFGPFDDIRGHCPGGVRVSVLMLKGKYLDAFASSVLPWYRKYLQDRSIPVSSFFKQAFGDGPVFAARVAQDVCASLQFYQRTFGPPAMPELRITMTPYSTSEAFPGMVALYVGGFLEQRAEARDWRALRAHEVAHQWWGLSVDIRTYHDHWLAEGMAEFSSLWFKREFERDSAAYESSLVAREREILKLAEERRQQGGSPSPVWLGYRASSTRAPADYQVNIYYKGAWVLHMLQALMSREGAGGDTAFSAGIRDYYARFAGRAASTDDFRRVMEQHAGRDLGWFFDQWIYGSAIPTYTTAYSTARRPSGDFTVSLRIRQSDVPEGFRMDVPVRIVLQDGRSVVRRVEVRGPLTQASVDVPAQPQEVVFNDHSAVLCRQEQAKW